MNTAQMMVSDGVTIAKRNVIKIKRVPDLIVFTMLSPIMFVLLFAYVFGSSIEIEGVNYTEYLIAGIFAQTVVFGATFTGKHPGWIFSFTFKWEYSSCIGESTRYILFHQPSNSISPICIGWEFNFRYA